MLQKITLNEASDLLDEDANQALQEDLSDVSLSSESDKALRKAQSSALTLTHQQNLDENQFDPLYYRTIPELDMHLKPLEGATGAHTSTFVDVEGQYVVQIPKEDTSEERRTQRDARLEHYQTYLEEDIPVTGEWQGKDIYVGSEEIPLLFGEYNPNLDQIEQLSGEKRQKADEQSEEIGEQVLDLINEGKVSYRDSHWQQTRYGHRSWDSERETVVVDDLGEYVGS